MNLQRERRETEKFKFNKKSFKLWQNLNTKFKSRNFAGSLKNLCLMSVFREAFVEAKSLKFKLFLNYKLC